MYTGAGVLPYTTLNGDVLVLLGAEYSRPSGSGRGYWCDFGGRREDNDVDERFTAAREFSEETRGVFNNGVDASSATNDECVNASVSNMLRILEKGEGVVRIMHRSYVLFIAPVPYVDERVFAVLAENQESQDPTEHRMWGEKRDVAWIPAEKLAWSALVAAPVSHRQRRHMVLSYRVIQALQAVSSAYGMNCVKLFEQLRGDAPASLQVWHMTNVIHTQQVQALCTTTISTDTSTEPSAATTDPEIQSTDVIVKSLAISSNENSENICTCECQDHQCGSAHKTESVLRIDDVLEQRCTSMYLSFAEWAETRHISDVPHRRRKRKHSVQQKHNPIPHPTQMWRDIIARKQEQLKKLHS